jgi:hypothetical protein
MTDWRASSFPDAHEETARYAQLKPGTTAIHMHYRGPRSQTAVRCRSAARSTST